MSDVALTGIRRSFGSVVALDGARLNACAGEVHAVLGENGAGKTTLLSILGGELQADAGEISLDGSVVRFGSPRDAWRSGVGMVHQHFALVDALSVLENLMLGASGRLLGPLPEADVRSRATDVAERSGLEIDLDRRVADLGVGERQRVEILKVLLRDPRVLILDEPTAVLTPGEVDPLLELVRGQAAAGRTVILVAHKLDEILRVADRVTVLRHGATVLEATRAEVDATSLSTAMVGDAFDVELPRLRVASPEVGDVVARLEGASARDPGGRPVSGIDLELRRGEIVGIVGVEGNGQRSLARLLAGIDHPIAGRADLPAHVGFVPQDRREEGLVPDFDLVENLALAWSARPEFRRGPWVRWGPLRTAAADALDRFGVRAASPAVAARTLSGGNQQRVVLAREFALAEDLLVAENPTRGLDVAGADGVRREILRLASGPEAPAVALVTTDLDEALALADRIFVLLRGRLTPVSRDAWSREAVGARMLAGDRPEPSA